jgi:multiple sugar transport system ATP-binding protein
MNHGKVVQVGRPLEVYRKPADTFVARFLGNPPMNLVDATLESRGGESIVRLARAEISLSPAIRTALGGRADGNVVLGIRPEDLYETPPPGYRTTARVPVRVVAVEPLGAETLVVVALDGGQEEIIARLGRDTALRAGDRIDIALDAGAIHLFDAVTTKVIAQS